MLSRRLLYEPSRRLRICRNLNPDSSPQLGRDWLGCVEDLMIRQLPIVIDQDTFTPWGGFDWTRRTLPNTTIARGRGTVATKSDRIRHAAFLEAGKENINAFRYQTKGYISDQARSERGVQKAPFGDKEEISIVLAKLRSGELSFEDPGAREMMFLYNALEQTGNLHIMFNAVEHAIKAVREWPKFQEGLRSFCKVCGEPSYKALVLKECFASAPKEARARLHQFSGQHVDFKWEHLEEIFLLGGGLDCGLFWDMKTYFVASCLSSKDSTIAQTLVAFLRVEFNGYFMEVLCLFTSAVGKEARWLGGCHCHGDILTGTGSRKRRRHNMISATGSGDCCWKGKRLVFFALGHGHVICSNVSQATSARYKFAVLTAPRQIAARMLEIEHELKTAWVGEVRPKWAYYETVAYKVCFSRVLTSSDSLLFSQ